MKLFNGEITQLNIGDIQGKLWDSFNLDLSFNQGKVSLAPRTIITTDSITNMGLPIGFKYFDTKWFTIAGTRIFFNGGTPQGNFSEDTSNNGLLYPPTNCSADYSDIELFNDTLLVSATDKLYTKASASGAGTGLYTPRRTFSSSTDFHALCVYNNRAYWLDSNQPPRIFSMDTSYAVSTSGDYTIQLPQEYVVTWMRAYSNGILIGTIHRFGGEGLVFDWDGVTTNKWNRAYKVYAQGALAGYVKDDVPVVVNSNGELLEFSGSSFRTIGRLPLRRDLLIRATNVSTSERFIHPNGLASIDGRISMLINSRNNNTSEVTYEPNIHAGIWESDGKSLYHKYSLSYRTRPDAGGSITDYGQVTLSRVGGLAETPDIFGTAQTLKGNFLAGATYFTNASSTGQGIWTDNYYDDVEKSGWFSTVQIRSQNFTDLWQRLTTLYVPVSGFSFVIKYRTERVNHTDFDITWTGTNTFTTTQAGLSEGDEITVIQGKGSGRVAHITGTPTFSSPNYTITLDEEITGVSGTARARKQNWVKCGTANNTGVKFDSVPIQSPDTLIELKIAMKWTGEATIDELVLDNTKQE